MLFLNPKKSFFFLIVSSCFFIVVAQEKTVTENTPPPFTKQQAIAEYNIFKADYRAKNYKDAFQHWLICFQKKPDLSVNIYKYGFEIVKKMKKITPDFNGKNWDAFTNEIYEKYFKYYPNHKDKIKMINDWAVFLNGLKDHQKINHTACTKSLKGLKPCIFEKFDKVYKKDPSQMSVKGIALYFREVVVQNTKNGVQNLSTVFDTYDKLVKATKDKLNNYSKKLDEYNLLLEKGGTLSSKETKKKKAYEINTVALGQIETILDKQLIDVSTCDRLKPFYSKTFEQNKTNAGWLSSAVKRMQKKNCDDDPFYNQLVEAYIEVEPSPKASVFYAGMLLKKGQEAKAKTYYEKAIAQETDNYKKADYLLVIAGMMKKKGKKVAARNYALQAIKNRKSLGSAYLLIASLYASSANQCGSSEFQKRMVFVAAKDMAIKALAVDPSVRKIATKYVKNYLANAPKKKDFFREGVKSGTSYKIGCWIQKTVTTP